MTKHPKPADEQRTRRELERLWLTEEAPTPGPPRERTDTDRAVDAWLERFLKDSDVCRTK
jgi:hypothetical protein